MMRRTKIVATLGPATDDPKVLDKLIEAQVDVVRLNFSHDTQEKHRQRAEAARERASAHGRPIGVIADLQGPKIRIGSFKNGSITLVEGDNFILDIDLVVVAIGNSSNPLIPATTPGLDCNRWGNIMANEETMLTSRKGVYAGGDIVTGGATVILAAGAGKVAARAMHAYMMGEVVEEKIDRENDTASYIESLIRVIKRILETENGKSFKRKVLGIGIGVSGLVDSEEGVLLQSTILNWNGVPIREILQREFSIPVYIENDVNTFAIGEKILGSGKSYDNFICVTIGRGVGMGTMINGKIYRGNHNGSGEFGHMKVCADSDAPLCSCGKRGCVEAYASDPAICGFVNSEIAKGKDSVLADKQIAGIADILDAARQGDSLAVKAFRTAGHYLGFGIANLINLLDPEMIIIGGEGTTAGEFIFPEMKKVIKENTVYGLAEKVKLIPIVFENNLWVRGAATLVIREVFSIPF